MSAWLAVIGSLFAMIIGLWKFFGRKAAEKRARIDAADKQFQEGMKERDPSKITAGLTDIDNE